MPKMKIVPKTRQQLMRLANPEQANQPEVLPWVLYDTQVYVDATTTSLTFFANTNNNKSLSNMESAGQIPDPQFFEIHYFGLDMQRLVTTTAGGIPGAINDVQALIYGDANTGAEAGRWTFNISNKRFGPFPLSFLHASGGVTGFMAGTWTAEESLAYANNGIFDGGFYVGGNLIIPPKVGFDVTLDWGGTVDLTADMALRMWMLGVLYRRVL
jgi:hypothetical protein